MSFLGHLKILFSLLILCLEVNCSDYGFADLDLGAISGGSANLANLGSLDLNNLEDINKIEIKKPVYAPNVDNDGDSLKRECACLQGGPDTEFFDKDFRVYNSTQLKAIYKKLKEKAKNISGKRASSKGINDGGPTPLKHKPTEEEPKGCGNPVCVVVDKKPRRFRSLCAFNKFLSEDRPGDQVNFVQKGDCYDIIENDGGRKKPWVDQKEVLASSTDCQACRDDPFCGKEIVINVDLSSVINGVSSAIGGELFHPETNKRMAGVPMEFESVCDAMIFFQTRENLNLKTQVIGYAIGTKETIYPQEGDRCLWTEWFDHNSPCGSDGDLELHSQHKSYLENSQTGPLRICEPADIKITQQQGGSEFTQIPVEEVSRGEGKGVPFDNTTFGQVLESSN